MSGTYEGTCKYCGSMQPILAVSQEEADQLISRTCSCDGAAQEERVDRICKNAEEISKGLEAPVKEVLATIGCLVQQGVINKATFKVENVTLTVSINANEQVKFKRKETNEKELQD